ncbi:hypothetical protein [Thiolinea disciformis]|uniref:hypothetical protein n=1 Tax=Thiolinea disciformis TaxID=125614 RepID=UPI0003720A73|nr:hypothetical protein [Thiolinea disciformis]
MKSLQRDGTYYTSDLKRRPLLTPRHRTYWDGNRSNFLPSPSSPTTRSIAQLLRWAAPNQIAQHLEA